MANKNPLLAWLFGAGPKEETEAPAKQAETPVLSETPPPKDNVTDPFRLTLASDHAVNKLWRLWTEQAGRQCPPSFRFEDLEGENEPIPAAQAKQELARLLLTVNASANRSSLKKQARHRRGPLRPQPWTPRR